MTANIHEQIACVRRELALRKNVYPKWVTNGRMKQVAADREMAALQAVHDTLEDTRRSMEAINLWKDECGKPQFFTITSGGSSDPQKAKASVEFTYTGPDALKDAQAMHSAIRALAHAFMPPDAKVEMQLPVGDQDAT